VLGAGRAVHELPARVRRGRDLVDLDHVVLPLDPARRGVIVAAMGLMAGVAVALVTGRGVIVFGAVVLVVVRVVLVAAAGERGRQELHPALRATALLVADDLRVHRAHVRRRADGHGEQLHAALRAA